MPDEPPDNDDSPPAPLPQATMNKICFRYEMIAAYHDRLAEEYQTLKTLDADAADVIQKNVEHHREQAAKLRENIAIHSVAGLVFGTDILRGEFLVLWPWKCLNVSPVRPR